MRNLYIDTLNTNLQLHDNQTNRDFWLQTPIEGLDSPDYRISPYDKPGEDGAIVPSMFYSSRTVSLKGIIKGSDPTAYEANRRLLSAACVISRDANGYPTPKRIQFTTLAGNTYFMDAFFRKPVFAHEEVNSSHFMLQMVVPKPSILGMTTISSGAILRASGGGFILPVILPIVSSGATGGSAVVSNDGDMIAYPLLTFTGPLTTPFVYSVQSDELMQLNYTINSGDVVVVDMLEKTIVLNGSTSLISTKTSDSDWWGILPGNNQINFSTGSSSDTGNLLITFNNAYMGI